MNREGRWLSGIEHNRTLDREIQILNLGTFVYHTSIKSLGMLLVYPKRMAVGDSPK